MCFEEEAIHTFKLEIQVLIANLSDPKLIEEKDIKDTKIYLSL